MGKLVVISAPSGTGKTTLVQALCEADPRLMVSISHTTRASRDGEENGIAYHFTEPDAFKEMIHAGKFLEHAEVFGNYYGTSKDTVESWLNNGYDVILEIDWQGGLRIRQLMPEYISIFILPPSYQALKKRLASRGSDALIIQQRMQDAINELSHHEEYQFLVINDDFGQALLEIQEILTAVRENREIQQKDLSQFIADLIAKT